MAELFSLYDPFLIISVAVGAGVIVGYFLAQWQRRRRIIVPNRELLKIIKQEQAQIMDLFEQQPQVTSNDIQQLLDASQATATRYLDQLEEQGLVEKKVDDHKIYYTKP